MSSTLGQPGFVPSNRVGQSGVNQSNIGSLGSGVLQTIEESAAAIDASVFYYDTSVGYYQLPSVQRSHGDDYRTFNVLNFGSRATMTLPRKFFNFGPAPIRFTLPIDYAWTGCEYVANFYHSKVASDIQALSQATSAGAPNKAEFDNTFTYPEGVRFHNHVNSNNAGLMFFESNGCNTMLPTSFQSGGLAFAFPQQIELNMGGAGLLQFDRYANWVAIMASCPFTQQRKDLMRMAGGGLCLDTDEEAKTMPVQWGLKPWLNSTGTSMTHSVVSVTNANRKWKFGAPNVNHNVSSITSVVGSTDTKQEYVPIMWDVMCLIKTPDTNFMYSLERRKPLDTSCFSSDFQITLTLSNFYEWSDTGKGFPNAPVYYAQHGKQATGIDGGNPAMYNTWNYVMGTNASTLSYVIGLQRPFTGTPPLGYATEANNFAHIGEIGAPVNVSLSTLPFWDIRAQGAAAKANFNKQHRMVGPVIHANPAVWTNHYRVASGVKMTNNVHILDARSTDYKFGKGDGSNIAIYGGRPRLPQLLIKGTAANDVIRSMQLDADTINSGLTYPTKFTSMEYINSSLKLTNPALGAYNALRAGNREAVLYYPLQYFYSQIYRVTTNPWKDFKNVTATNLLDTMYGTKLKDVTSQSNKITQMIQMPANPCTALFTCIFREKDRVTNVVNKLNSYNPVLFWNALNPIRMDLKDAGNTLFSYKNNVDFELYSFLDRPDALKIPFRGGHVKVMPKNCYGNRYMCSAGPANSGMLVFGNYPLDQATANGINIDSQESVANANPYILADIGVDILPAPYWYTKATGGVIDKGSGVRGVYKDQDGNTVEAKSHPSDSTNAFPADDLVNSVCVRNGLRSAACAPCHTTDWYEATIIEFPFVMSEPITSEKIVQQTPSFARTQLQLDFWIEPFLKADNGFDDMYDTTYGLTRAAPSGIPVGAVSADPNALSVDQLAAHGTGIRSLYAYGGPLSHPVPDCLHEGGCGPFSSQLAYRDKIPEDAVGTGPTAKLSGQQLYADGFKFANATSWNINNGNLMLHVTFCQNQVWTISPLRTSLLSARG